MSARIDCARPCSACSPIYNPQRRRGRALSCARLASACLRGIEIEADVVLKATKVDGVFTADPAKDPTATMYEQLTYSEVLEKELKVMDLAAFTLARDHKLPIRVFNMNKPGALRRVVMGEKEGTLITE